MKIVVYYIFLIVYILHKVCYGIKDPRRFFGGGIPPSGKSSPSAPLPPPKNDDCKLDIEEFNKRYEPLYLLKDKDGDLEIASPNLEEKFFSFMGTNKVLNIKHEEEITIACLGKDNMLVQSSESVNQAKCHGDSQLSVKGPNGFEVHDYRKLNCKFPIEGKSKKTDDKCGNEDKGIYVLIGFEVDGAFVQQFVVCHNLETSNTLFSLYEITGGYLSSTVNLVPDNAKFFQDADELYKDIDINFAYKERNQEIVMTRGIGLWETKRLIGRRNGHYWVPGQLAHPDSFLFDTLKFNTNFYVNAAPQWPSIKNGHWRSLNSDVRKLANKMSMHLLIASGTHEILDLVDIGGRAHMALSGKGEKDKLKIYVPKHFWMVVQSTDLKACVGFIITNDPFKQQRPKPLCVDRCKEFRWRILQAPFKKGYVYCCEIDDMRKSIPDIPPFECNRILPGR